MIPPGDLRQLVRWARSNGLGSVSVEWHRQGDWHGAITKGEDEEVVAHSKTEAGLCVSLYHLARTKLLGRS